MFYCYQSPNEKSKFVAWLFKTWQLHTFPDLSSNMAKKKLFQRIDVFIVPKAFITYFQDYPMQLITHHFHKVPFLFSLLSDKYLKVLKYV